MKNIKKILGLLLSIAMVASLLPNLAMAAETDGYYIKLEETDAKDRNSFGDVRTNEFFSGGQARSFGNKNAPGEDGYYIEFEVDIKKAGDYKIWVHGGRSGPDWSSPTKIVIDGTTTLSCTNGDVTSWSAKDYGINHALAFQYVDAKLTKGKHVIRYMINEVAPSNTSYYLGAFDFMLVVPANYSWTQSKTALPTAPVYKEFDADGYAWLQEKDYSANVGSFSKRTDGAFSDGEAYTLDTKSGTSYSLDYYLEVPESGSYDIWIRGTVPHEYASPAKVQLNGETIAMSKVGGDVWYSGKWVYGWNKATVNLDAGKLDLRYLIDEKRPSGNDYFFAVLDMICIVPTSYEWTQSLTDKPVKPIVPTPTPEPEHKKFNEEGYLWLEAETDYGTKNSGWVTGLEDYHTKDAVSEGSGLAISQDVAPGATGYNVDFYIDVEEAGNYDIWVYGGKIGYGWISPGKIQIDGTDIAPQLAYYSRDDWGKLGGNGINLGWNKATVALEAGEQTLRYYINDDVASKAGTYQNALDVICISPVDYGWTPAGTGKTTAKPKKPEVFDVTSDTMVWLNAENSSGRNKTSGVSSNSLYGGEGVTVATSTAPTESNQYYLQFKLNAEESAKYDIYLRGSSYRSEWNSEPTINLNGTDYKITDMGYDEGWVDSNYNLAWSKVEGVTIPAGDSVLKWIIKTSRTASSEYYIAIFDAFLILPEGAPFKPVGKDLASTELDAELALSVAGQSFLAPRANVTLPATSFSGKSIVWSTSDADIFATNGKITRSWYNDPVTVTAVLGNEYTREFDVVVPALVDFALDGEMNVGDTEVNATVYFNEDATDKSVTVIPVIYDANGVVKAVSVLPKSFTQEDNYLDIEMTLEEAVEAGDKLEVLVWNGMNKMTPANPKLTLGNDILLKPFTEDVCLHIDEMEAFLNDSYENIANYADGEERLDTPKPVTFRWSWNGTDAEPSEYTLKVSESTDMANAKVFTTDAEFYNVYNLKVNTEYYWTISATDANGNTMVSNIGTMKTEDKAPRIILIGGGFNARDVGGWDTLDGSQVKQGYLYRTGRLHYISSTDGTTLKNQLNSAGIKTMAEDLGIKTEIELRQADEMPLEYTESILGADVNYVRAPMNYQGDYLSQNKESIKTVFATFANPENYPIVYHCAAGADRTGAITYLLNGLLGVSQEDLFRDYLITNFTSQGFRPVSNIANLYVKTINEYRGETIAEKVYNYLSEVIEVPTEQLDFIIGYLK